MSTRSTLTCIISDIHFPHHMPAAWAAFREFHRETRPETTVIGGDFLDLAQLSSFVQDPRENVYVLPEIQMFVREANALAEECGELIIVEGNHEARWSRFIEPVAVKLRGAVGLTLREQCIAQGLTPRARWYKENSQNRGIKVQQFIFRHGDKDFGKFGGGKNAASALIDKTYGGESPIVGHLHQCQLVCRRRADGVLLTAVLNGTFEKPADYDPKNPWIYSFTLLERCNDQWATPHPVIIENGVFAYGGRIYDGNEEARRLSYGVPAPRAYDARSDVMLPSKPPYPVHIPHEDPLPAPIRHDNDRIGQIVEELSGLGVEINRTLENADRSLDEPIRPRAIIPPPSPPPRNERPTRDDLSGSSSTEWTHPKTLESATSSAWARILNVPRKTLSDRLERAMREERKGSKAYTLEDALSPTGKREE